MAGEWGPWIEHDGNGCPLEVMGQEIEVFFRLDGGGEDGWRHNVAFVDDLFASCSTWHAAKYEGSGCFQHWGGKRLDLPGGPHWVDRYRIRRPRGLTILQKLLADLPHPEKVGA